MRFFMPYWDDRLDPEFDFQGDRYSPGRDIAQDVYAHQIYRDPLYDGLLLSRAVVEKNRTGYEALKEQGARSYLRLGSGLQVFGDCGAFSYVNDDEPRYQTEDVIDYYCTLGVDYGASVDHLVVSTYHVEAETDSLGSGKTSDAGHRTKKVSMSEEEAQRRIALTLKNAREFIETHRRKRCEFTPVGVAQGDTPQAYADSVRQLLAMGYTYVALGGLARSPASQVLDVVEAVREVLDNSSRPTRLHLFGVAQLGIVKRLVELGTTSIDSASYLRKAWLRSGQNYLGPDGEWYTAIRIPQSQHPRVQAFIRENGKSLEEVQAQEELCLKTLERHNASSLDQNELEDLLDLIVDYDAYMLRHGDDGHDLRNKKQTRAKYWRTLVNRPWERCGCEICRDLGVHVLIFRGTNRNKRRGFHNTWTFYRRLKGICPELPDSWPGGGVLSDVQDL